MLEQEPVPSVQCRQYRRRWFMLLIFVLCSTANAAHWMQYSIIANIMMRYYNVSSISINWTSMIYMACYIPFVFPASWVLQRKGLRITLLSGAIIMVTGSWLKVLSASPDLFYLAFIGQALVGTAQIFILGVPARLAAVWFGPKQVSTACSLGVFGNQVGIALGFLIPPAVVGNHEDLEVIGRELKHLYYGMAIGPTIVLCLVIFFFQKEPPMPPSLAQASLRSKTTKTEAYDNNHTYLQSLKSLITNRNFALLLVSYGINIGVFYVVSTLLNQIVLLHFADAEEDAGRIGLTIVVAGVVGSVTGGVVLDKTHKFKECTLVVYFMALAGMLAFTFTLTLGHIWIIYLTGGFLGFFMTGYLGIGYEFAAELTYPIAEGTSSGLLNASSEVFGVIFTLVGGEILDAYGDIVTNCTLTALLLAGLAMTLFIQGKDLKRQAAAALRRSHTHLEQEDMMTTQT
ncbi:choline/ethanolamine transporter flvcr2a-like [Periplaneta americana]|uniref:choline/ethanolamine transporter flvcr2a-like n=1 Tax=Periplaneta americana TaxID=6978 RepID=UPI0037E7F47A